MAKVVDILNLTAADMVAVGGSATTVPAYSRVDGVTLLDAEFGVAFDTLGLAMIKSANTEQQKRLAGRMLKRTSPYFGA